MASILRFACLAAVLLIAGIGAAPTASAEFCPDGDYSTHCQPVRYAERLTNAKLAPEDCRNPKDLLWCGAFED